MLISSLISNLSFSISSFIVSKTSPVSFSTFDTLRIISSDLIKNSSINLNNSYGINITVYKYINHELVTESFKSNISSEFNKKVIYLINDKLLNYRDNTDITKNNGTLNLNDSNNMFIGHMNEGTNVFINSLTKKEINHNENIYILVYNTDDGYFYYITNLDSSTINKFKKW